MNKQQAINLIKDTFEKPFEKSQFIYFISNLLNLKQNEIINEHPYSGNYIPEAYRQYINSLYRIAKYEDDSGKKIDVLIVRLEKVTSLERARSMQRNFIAWYLKLSRGYYKDAALVAFVSPDDEDWRFSFVKIQYLFKDNKAAEMLSSALRYSFLVGENEISYTAQSQLIPFLIDDKNKPSLEMLEQAFSVEKVSNKFFKEYKFLYEKALDEFNSNEVFTKVLEQNSNLSVDLFVRKLLGQVVFLYFLQKKGWLGIKINELGWKNGNRKFLRWAFEDCKKKDKNYFDRFLQPLFYAGFNKKEELFQYDEFQFKIPFLNGGLFEELFHWESTFINPANTLFSNKEIQKDGSIGTGILDIFDRYNFTIDENTAFEKEIAVDPEMLGKVFENLLPDNLRKGKGAYYTPREIVSYMTKESLVNFLTSKITPADSDDKAKIEEKVRRLFDYKDLYINKKNKDKYGKEFEQQFYEMLDIVESVNKHLQAIKIVDPACGSGAFPMGILLEIVSLREYIENEFLDNIISSYQLKKETIQNSIYGVDIDPGAVEIAKLRFWLSLVVDAEKPEPLPNLYYKIMQGNSLIESFEGIDLSRVMSDNYFEMTLVDSQMDIFKDNTKQQKMIFSNKRKENIINLKNKYYLETDPNKKKEIHQKIDKIVLEHIHYNLETKKEKLLLSLQELKKDLKKLFVDLNSFSQIKQLLKTNKNAKQIERTKKEIFEIDLKFKKLKELEKSIERPYFLWHLFFSEIFEKENNGFDIVIANPPYIKEYTDKHAFDELRNSDYYQGKMDIWYLFACKHLDLLKKNGILTFIATNNWVTNYSASIMRNKVINETQILQLIDFNNYKIFISAGIQTMIMFFRNNEETDNYKFDYRKLKNKAIEFSDVSDLLNCYHTDKNIILKPIVKKNELLNKSLIFNNPKIEDILRKIEGKENFKLSEKEVANGIHSHHDFVKKNMLKILGDKFNIGDGIFALNDFELENLNLLESETELIKPYFTTNELHKYYGDNKNKYWIIYTSSEFRNPDKIKPYPNMKNHLDKFRKVITSDFKPYGLHRTRKEKFFKGQKIIALRKCSKEPIFTYTDFNCYVSATFYVIKTKRTDLKFLTGFLNSKLCAFWLRHKGKMQGNNYQVDKEPLINIPIKKISKENQQSFIKLVDKILTDKKAGKDTQKLEDKIDLMVYKLYDLKKEEIKIVEGN